MNNRIKKYFCIAGHFVVLDWPVAFDEERLLPSFRPFKVDSIDEKEPICSIRIVEEPIVVDLESVKVLSEVPGILGHHFCLMEGKDKYISDIQLTKKGNTFRMVTDKIFATGTIYVNGSDSSAVIILSSFLMILFAQSAVLHNTLLIHASVIEKAGQGYAFLGKSGTGKSTHSSLWLSYVDGSELLNDDNPALRVEEDGTVSVYGTPWSGKTPCYKNRRAPLNALVRLEQASANRLVWKKGAAAVITVLPSCSSLRWNGSLYTAMCNVLEKIVGRVAVGYLECLPNKEAAILCYESMKQL